MKKIYLFIACCTMLLAGAWSTGTYGMVINGEFMIGTWSLDLETGEMYIDGKSMPDCYDWQTKTLCPADTNAIPAYPIHLDSTTCILVNCAFPWYPHIASIKHIVFSPTIERIGERAFLGAYNLQSVKFEDREDGKTVDIAKWAFRDCWSLTYFDFRYASRIEEYAFYISALQSAELPSVTYLGNAIFGHCKGLEWGNTYQYDKAPKIRITCANMPELQNNGEDWVLTYRDAPTMVPYSQMKEWTAIPGDEMYKSANRFFYGEQYDVNPATGKAAFWYIRQRYTDDDAPFDMLVVCGAYSNTPDKGSEYDLPWNDAKTKHPIEQACFVEMRSIPSFALANCESLTTVELGGTESIIFPWAFKGCSKLKDINLSGISAISSYAFEDCTSLKEVQLTSLLGTGDYAFHNCTNLERVFIGNKLNYLGDKSFDGIKAKEVHIQSAPPTGEMLGDNVFSHLQSGNHKLFVRTEYFNLFDMTKDPWNNFTSIDYDFNYPIKGNGWTFKEGGKLVIHDASVLDNVKRPEDVPWAYLAPYVKKVEMDGDDNRIMGKYACYNMTNLEEVTSSIYGAKDYAFAGCTNLNYVPIVGRHNDSENKKDEIGSCAFLNCKSLKQIKIGPSVKSIGEYAFSRCDNLKTVQCEAPEPPQIESNSFDVPEAIQLTVPQESVLKYIQADIWKQFVLSYEGSEHGVIYTSGPFYDGYYILYSDNTLYCYANSTKGTADIFGSEKENYQYVGQVEIDGKINKLEGDFGFADMPFLSTVTIKAPVKEINGCFKDCKKLVKVTLPNNNLSLGDETFKGCTQLSTINMNHVVSIGENCFNGCTGMREISLPRAKQIGDYAFMNCTGLKTADLGNAEIGKYLFWFCSNLESAKLNAISIGSGTFEQCTKFKTIHLGENVNIIDAPFFGTALSTIYYTRPYPAGGPFGSKIFENSSGSLKIDVTKITLYVPAACIDVYKRCTEWKDMIIKNDPSIDLSQWALPASGSFNDKLSSWAIDKDGNMTVLILGKQNEWPKGDFNTIYDHPLQLWMPFIKNVNIIGKNAEVMSRLIPEFGGYGDAYQGIKTLTIGSGIKSLGYSFCPYRQLTDVYCYTEDVPAGDDAFAWYSLDVNPVHVRLHVLAKEGVKEKYQKHPKWSKFAEIIADLDAPTYVVAIDALHGKVVAKEANIDFNAVPENTVLHLIAKPDQGYHFVRWENYDPSTGLTVTDNISITAVFEADDLSKMEVGYTCDFTKKANGNTRYDNTWTYDNDWSVYGGANNNTVWPYVRMGGKSATLANANPVHITNKNAFSKQITGVRVYYPEGSLNMYNMEVNEWGVKVYKDLQCKELLYTVNGSEITPEECTLTIMAPEDQVWAAGYGIQVYWKLTNGSNDNGVVYVSKIEYLTEKEVPVVEKFTIRFIDWDGAVLQSSEVEKGMMPSYEGPTPYHPEENGVNFIFTGWSPAITAATADADYTAQFVETTGLDEKSQVRPARANSQKLLRNGILLIERNGKTYNALGTEVR